MLGMPWWLSYDSAYQYCSGGSGSPPRVGGGGSSASALSREEQFARDNAVSVDCADGLLKATGTSTAASAALERARSEVGTLQSAAAQAGFDWQVLAAIGIHETGFQSKDEIGGGLGRGVFQIDLGQNPNVTEEQANDLEWAAAFVAKNLAHNAATLVNNYGLGGSLLIGATAASHNAGLGGVMNRIQSLTRRGAPITLESIDLATYPRGGRRDYGQVVLKISGCF
jgi:hypothetical protein